MEIEINTAVRVSIYFCHNHRNLMRVFLFFWFILFFYTNNTQLTNGTYSIIFLTDTNTYDIYDANKKSWTIDAKSKASTLWVARKRRKKHNTKTKMRNEAVVKRTKMTWCSVINTFQLKKISSWSKKKKKNTIGSLIKIIKIFVSIGRVHCIEKRYKMLFKVMGWLGHSG